MTQLKNKSFVNENLELNAKFYLVYRERDGRFFCVSDNDIDVTEELNLSLPPVVDVLSTHISLNEGQNLKEIFDKHFKDTATNDLPCKVESKDKLLYCGVTFEKVKLNLEMYQLELCKNPPVKSVNILEISKGNEIDKFKKQLENG